VCVCVCVCVHLSANMPVSVSFFHLLFMVCYLWGGGVRLSWSTLSVCLLWSFDSHVLQQYIGTLFLSLYQPPPRY
jgi:hypothetical protein